MNMIHEIDLYFPYLVLVYGLFMTVATSLPALQQKAGESMNEELVQWFYGHRVLGLVCLAVGGLWTLQRVLMSL